MLKRLMITAVSAAILGCALVSCGNNGAGSGDTLRWRTAIDVPVNFSLPVGQDLNKTSLVPGCADLPPELLLLYNLNCDSLTAEDSLVMTEMLDSLLGESKLPDTSILVDLGTDTVSTASDVIDFLGKLTNTNIKYSVWVTNRTQATLTFYGMFFPKNDRIARDSIEQYYRKIQGDSTRGGRVNVFPPYKTMRVEANGGTETYECTSTVVGESLADLIINKKAFSWRWLVRLETGDYGSLGNANNGSADSVDIKLRIRFSGINSIDSLFTL